MTAQANERVVYLNGEILPESRAAISFRDTGFVYGDAVFDTARTFGGKPFRLKDHIDRLYETLAYVRIDPSLTKAEMTEKTEEIVARNAPLLGPDQDYWVTQRVSRGVSPVDGEVPDRVGATVLIECMPLPLKARAAMFRDGIDAVVAPQIRTPPTALSPAAKTNNYMNFMLAQREVASVAAGAWAVLLDQNGNLCEGPGCNIFLIKDGVVSTPTPEFVLCGVTRRTVIDLCRDNGVDLVERNLSLHDAAVADEAFFTSTSLCICPVRSLNGKHFPAMPGPVTDRLTALFADLAGFDFRAQYLANLSDRETGTGF